MGHPQKVDSNKSGSWDYFDFVRWYVDEEFSLYSAEDSEHDMIQESMCKKVLYMN